MQVFKFGGSVLKDTTGIRWMTEVLRRAGRQLVVVVSAFGKTTNALEEIASLTAGEKKQDKVKAVRRIGEVKKYHLQVLREVLTGAPSLAEAEEKLEALFSELMKLTEAPSRISPEEWYNRIVPYGERFSSMAVYYVLAREFPGLVHTDIRKIIIAGSPDGTAGVDWEETTRRVLRTFSPAGNLFLTQGFIAGTRDGRTTTLGREGSDFTAAILGSILNADKVVLWKDVPGVMNADPKICPEAVRLPGISYQEAAEMAFYGAKVIHPKTIKPLQNKHIPLVVRGLAGPDNPGTTIWDFEEMERHVPVYIRKERQILLSVFPRDYSFILNRHLEDLFGAFKKWKFNISLVQISAISVSFCIDDPGMSFMERVKELQNRYEVYFNRETELLTFRHYTEKTIREKLKNCHTLVSQRTRLTAQYVVKRIAGE